MSTEIPVTLRFSANDYFDDLSNKSIGITVKALPSVDSPFFVHLESGTLSCVVQSVEHTFRMGSGHSITIQLIPV